jgi:hypothetical protein
MPRVRGVPYGSGMRIAALALVSAAVLVLAGCTPAPHPTTSPRPVATPVFTSDAAALAAAKKAYERYSRVADSILADGGADPGRIDGVTTGDLRKQEHEGSADFAAKGYKESGTASIKFIRLQSADLAATHDTEDAVVTYVCIDVSGIDVLDPSGKSVVSPTRQTELSYQVSFELVNSKLLPSKQESWDSGGVCG